ncbi:unnamed protein product, partial [Prorocentrum cordatum]
VKAAEGRGIQRPFLYLRIKKFLPYYATDKRQPSAAEECVEERSFAEEIARGICQARDPDRKQGDLPSILQWRVAFDRWAIVAELTGQMAYAASMAHKEVVMQLALSGRSNQRTAAIAVFCDEDSFDAAKAALSQDSPIVLRTEREYLARGLPVLQDSAPSQPRGKGKGGARDHKGGSDYRAKSAKAKGHSKGDKGYGKEHKGLLVRERRQRLAGACDAAIQAPDDGDCLVAIQWNAERSLAQCICEREQRVRRIEVMAAQFEASGAAEAERRAAPPHFGLLVAGVNIPPMRQLARESAWHDAECADFPTRGAPLMGNLACSGNGRALGPGERPGDAGAAVEELRSSALAGNASLLSSIRADPLASELLQKARGEAGLGRMSPPRAFKPGVSASELAAAWGETIRLAPRFGVPQPKPDGSTKVRPMDDFTRSGVNGARAPAEKLGVEGVDMLVALARVFYASRGEIPELWKADIDSAYRRIPLDPADRWAAVSIFKQGDRLWCSQHQVCPFGALASCHDWGRVAAMLAHFARQLAKLPVLRYVDDYFSPDRSGAVEHAKLCFARVIRAALGSSAVADSKLAHGAQLVVLGVLFSFSARGIHCEPAEDKRLKWSA